MRKEDDGWLGALRALGRAGTDLFRSEIDALGSDLAESADRLTRATVLFLAAAFVVFWAIGALGFFSFELLALWLPRWSAALIIFLLLVIVIWVLWMLGKRKLGEVEWPADTVRRRVGDHLDWWQARVLSDTVGGRDRLESGVGKESEE